MLCLLLIAFALMVCVVAEFEEQTNLRTHGHVLFPVTKGNQPRKQLAVALGEQADAVSSMSFSPSPVRTYFTGSFFQVQTNTNDCANPTGNAYKESSFRLGACRSHYLPRKGQSKSTLLYLQQNTTENSYSINAQSYSDDDCSPEKLISDLALTTGSNCEDGVKAMWASKSSPHYAGLVNTFHYGSQCPTGPLDGKHAIFSYINTPLQVCTNDDPSGSHIMSSCRIDNGNVYVTGYAYEEPDCMGVVSLINDMDFGPACKKNGRNAFETVSCILPTP